jgi:hypothetical protein
LGDEFTTFFSGRVMDSAMSNHNAAVADAVVPFAPKLNRRSETSDTLDGAGQAILGMLNKAASAAEANCQQAVEIANTELRIP